MDTIRLVSWNVNGFRALSGKPDWDWFASTDADVVALQETKAEPAQIADHLAQPVPSVLRILPRTFKGLHTLTLSPSIMPRDGE